MTSFSVLIGKTVSNRVSVAAKKERGVAPLQCDRKSLEKLLCLQIGRNALPRRAVGGDRLQCLDGCCIPSTESLHDEGLEEKPSSSAIKGVFPHLLIFPHLDGGSSVSGGPVNDHVLGWRYDAYIEGHPPSVSPSFHEDISRSRLGSRDEGRHFLLGVETSSLSFFEDFVPDAVMSSTPDTMVIAAVHCMVSLFIKFLVAVIGWAGRGRHDAEAESIQHGLCKGTRVHVEMEGGRGDNF